MSRSRTQCICNLFRIHSRTRANPTDDNNNAQINANKAVKADLFMFRGVLETQLLLRLVPLHLQIGLKECYDGVWPFISSTNAVRCVRSFRYRCCPIQYPNCPGDPEGVTEPPFGLLMTRPFTLSALLHRHLTKVLLVGAAPRQDLTLPSPLLSQRHLVHHLVARHSCFIYSPMSLWVVCVILSRKPYQCRLESRKSEKKNKKTKKKKARSAFHALKAALYRGISASLTMH